MLIAKGYKPNGAIRLHVEPLTISAADRVITRIHRHHGPVAEGWGVLFACCVVDEAGEVHGVAIAGFPRAANRLKDGYGALEVQRVATDGTPNACSALYAACARAGKALGFRRAITYVLDSEQGISVKAAGWTQDPGIYGGQSWTVHSIFPGKGSNTGPKNRWSVVLNTGSLKQRAIPEKETDDGQLPMFV